MPKDELRRLSDHVVAPLLRALMCIPRRPESRLHLRRAVPPRLHRNAEDYRVFARECPVGSIWLDPAPERLEEKIVPWCWSVDTTNGGTNMEGWWSSGRGRNARGSDGCIPQCLGHLSAEEKPPSPARLSRAGKEKAPARTGATWEVT